MYVLGSEGLFFIGLCGDSVGDFVEFFEDGGGVFDFSFFDVGIFGDFEDDFFVEFLDFEEGGGGVYGGFEKFVDVL